MELFFGSWLDGDNNGGGPAIGIIMEDAYKEIRKIHTPIRGNYANGYCCMLKYVIFLYKSIKKRRSYVKNHNTDSIARHYILERGGENDHGSNVLQYAYFDLTLKCRP